SSISETRKPNFIHVAGSYLIFRAKKGMVLGNRDTGVQEKIEENQYYVVSSDPDLHGIVWVLNELQIKASGSTHILFSYNGIINRVTWPS
ncbi:MAG: hypothetical protein ACTSY1_09785, partial [Alphaproteobacteria bacterium]